MSMSYLHKYKIPTYNFMLSTYIYPQQYNVTATYMDKLCRDQCVKPTQKSYTYNISRAFYFKRRRQLPSHFF